MTSDFEHQVRRRALPPPRAGATGWSELDTRAVDTAQVLAADAVQKVGNGHPDTVMSLAAVAYLLFQDVLSCGHTSLTSTGDRP